MVVTTESRRRLIHEARIRRALLDALAPPDECGAHACPPRLLAAMRAAVLSGGGRVRPKLALAVAAACGDDAPPLSNAVAAAVELIHCASLVHDDLPCFDDAETRRGQPTIHRQFGEETAVLVGDALIVRAFEVIARAGARPGVPVRRVPALVGEVARAAGGFEGIAAGQAWESEPAVELSAYHRAKTGALFRASACGGALAAGADPRPWGRMATLLGEAYQVADDLADALGHAAELGKPVDQDAALARPNAVRRLGVEGALLRLERLAVEAVDVIPECPGRGALAELLDAVVRRLMPRRSPRAHAARA